MGDDLRAMAAARERLVVALDLASTEEAQAVVAALDGLVSFYKIGLHLQLRTGTERFIDTLIEAGRRVFIDYKFADIPATVRGGVAGAASRGVDFATVQGTADDLRPVLDAAVEGRGASALRLLLVTVLTSVACHGIEERVLARARAAYDAGFDGVVTSGHEAGRIKAELGGRPFLVVVPGIRPADVGRDDHKRTLTPAAAISAGADYLVVGRPIVAAADRAAAARAILAEMATALGDDPE